VLDTHPVACLRVALASATRPASRAPPTPAARWPMPVTWRW
jgi:hypothetical protein